ncbi:ATP synthase subunit I [Robertmurraya kyonggiensis]|uniref:ATP synthase subunit I n=1 Tax=Robertmurraya kyonggiensis TaxID=1037680 RepID=A0A4U1D536_9BACI|nr:ATP synthase subunit I [Robertmurraya kyonggiensis]TKC16928.1 ATP synthase subunit I [Robertmurraya kyonggiensis]
MPDVQTIYRQQQKYILFLLSIYVLGWGFTTYKTIFLGLILGTAFGLFNMWLLAKRMDKFGKAVVSGGRVRSLGMISRMATAILAVMLSVKYPDVIHLYSVILGLMTPYFVIMIEFFKQAIHPHN